MDNPILQKLGMLSNKMSANHVLQGISKGVMGVLPVIIVGAFASLFLGLFSLFGLGLGNTLLDSVLQVLCDRDARSEDTFHQ